MRNTKLINKRKELGLTQVEVARAARVTTVCYQRYEAGERLPRVDKAILMAHTLNSTVEELFGEAQ